MIFRHTISLLLVFTLAQSLSYSQDFEINTTVSKGHLQLPGVNKFKTKRAHIVYKNKLIAIKKTNDGLFIQHFDTSNFEQIYVSTPHTVPFDDFRIDEILNFNDSIYILTHANKKEDPYDSNTNFDNVKERTKDNRIFYLYQLSEDKKNFVGSPKKIHNVGSYENICFEKTKKYVATLNLVRKSNDDFGTASFRIYDHQLNQIDSITLPPNSRVKDFHIGNGKLLLIMDEYTDYDEENNYAEGVKTQFVAYDIKTKQISFNKLKINGKDFFPSAGSLILKNDKIYFGGIMREDNSFFSGSIFAAKTNSFFFPDASFLISLDSDGSILTENIFKFNEDFYESQYYKGKDRNIQVMLNTFQIDYVDLSNNEFNIGLSRYHSVQTSFNPTNFLKKNLSPPPTEIPTGNSIIIKMNLQSPDKSSYHIIYKAQVEGFSGDANETGSFYFRTDNNTYIIFMDHEDNHFKNNSNRPELYRGSITKDGALIVYKLEHQSGILSKSIAFKKKGVNGRKVDNYRLNQVFKLSEGKVTLEMVAKNGSGDLVFITLSLD